MDSKVNTTASKSGIGFLGILTLIFITLKLLGKITWSWLWVLAPIWIPAALCALFFLVFLVILFVFKR